MGRARRLNKRVTRPTLAQGLQIWIGEHPAKLLWNSARIARHRNSFLSTAQFWDPLRKDPALLDGIHPHSLWKVLSDVLEGNGENTRLTVAIESRIRLIFQVAIRIIVCLVCEAAELTVCFALTSWSGFFYSQYAVMGETSRRKL
jgi:hypothetical protein